MNYKKLPTIDYKKLKSFKVRISQIPPFDVAFKTMTLSDYEMLVATIYRLNELIEINQDFIDFNKEIWEWVTNEGISLAVLERLTEWLNDGTLETLINETLLNMKLDKSEFEEYKTILNQTLLDLEQNIQSIIDGEVNRIDGELEDLDNDIQEVTAQLAQTTLDYISLGKSLEGGTSDKDNHSLLTNLVAKAKTEKKGLYIPNGKYYLSDDLEIDMIQNIKIDGTIIMAEDKMLTLRNNSARVDSCDWVVNQVTGKLRVSGLKNGKVTVLYADELELYADRTISTISSLAYSQFWLGTIKTLRLTSPNTGWINENSFYGGRISNIYFDGEYPHNNNTFYKPMLEGFNAYINTGSNNVFTGCRFEGVNNIVFGENATFNIFYRQWIYDFTYYRTLNQTAFIDNGKNNFIVSEPDNFHITENIFKMDLKSNNFNLDRVVKNKENLSLSIYTTFFDTGIIDLDESFSLSVLSKNPSEPLIRLRIYSFDIDGNEISTNENLTSYFCSGPSLVWSEAFKRYSTPALSHVIVGLIANHPNVKKIRITAETSAALTTDGIQVDVKKKSNSIKEVTNILETSGLVSDTIPTEGYWFAGEKIYNSNPVSGGYTGWVCVTEGNPGEWKGFGLIQS